MRPALQGHGILRGCSAPPSRSPSSPPRCRGLWLGLERAERRHDDQRDGEHQRRHGRLQPGRGPRGGRPRRAPGQGRRLRRAALRHRAARRPAADLRRRAGGADRRRARRQAAGPAVPRHPLEGHGRRRAGPALDGLRARLRAVGAVLRLLHREERHRERSGSTTAPAPTAPTPAARGSCCAWTTPSPTTTAA